MAICFKFKIKSPRNPLLYQIYTQIGAELGRFPLSKGLLILSDKG